MSNTPDNPLHPIATDSAARLPALDFIRGIAVMGILGANIIAFGQPLVAYFWPGGFATPPQPSDTWLWAGQFLLIDGKMRGLFTLLFGAGLALFAERARARGAGSWLAVRRLGWLLVFGLAHYYLLWRGDILTLYAMCGLIALLALSLRPAQQLGAGVVAYLFMALWHAVPLAMLWAADDPSALSGLRADGAVEIALAAHGSWAQYVAHAFGAHRWDWLELFGFSVFETLPLMLVGMGLYRAGLFDGRIDPRTQARWGWAGVVGGTALTALVAWWAVADGLSYGTTLLAIEGPGALTRLPVVLGLAALLALWAPRATGWLGRRVNAAGRMAFSNYLGTSLVMLLVFQRPGLGLYGRLDRAELYLVMLAAWALMLAWSAPWLARFRHGPLEWLWRCLTYAKVLPLRR